MASHCSLHSCTSSELAPSNDCSNASYCTSLSSDTLYWDTNNENPPVVPARSQQGKIVSCQQYIQQQQQAPTYGHYNHSHATPAQPQAQQTIQHYHHPQFVNSKPKSWDNLAESSKTSNGTAGFCFGYGYFDIVGGRNGTKQTDKCDSYRPPITMQQQRHSIPRKQQSFERYSAYVENYAPPPMQFLQETTTITTTITTKSTENLIAPCYTDSSCECLVYQQQKNGIDNAAYYAKVPQPVRGYVAQNVPAVSEVTRL